MSVNLDNRNEVTARDPQGLLTLADQFPEQCRTAVALAESATLGELPGRPSVVVVAGMGGSAAGGEITRILFEDRSLVPFVVVREGKMPSYVGLGDLVLCVSYSGNTAETLEAYQAARRAGAKIVAITSGGELAERAKSDRVPLISVPAGYPPRSALGLLTLPVIVACVRHKVLPPIDFEPMFTLLADLQKAWTVEGSDPQPKHLAQAMLHRVPFFYALGPTLTPVALRWRCQINENAKHLAFHHTYPELNHNEIVGWGLSAPQGMRPIVVTLGVPESGDELRLRQAETENILADRGDFYRVELGGASRVEQLMSGCYLADYNSLYLAALAGQDPGDIAAIDTLKAALSRKNSLAISDGEN